MRRVSGAAAIALLVSAQALPATVVRTLSPVDDAAGRPEFFSFRASLLAAVGRRDAAAIRAVVHPGIRNSFGPDDGAPTFERQWRLDEADSPFWGEFAAVLALGGAFTGPDTFVAPYTFVRWPEDLDAFDHVAVVGSNVRLRAAPSLEGAVVGRVSFGVLARARASAAGEEWTAVRWGAGTAFVASRLARSPVDYRAFFTREDGRWWLTAFVAGD